jgi:hypothetical protein
LLFFELLLTPCRCSIDGEYEPGMLNLMGRATTSLGLSAGPLSLGLRGLGGSIAWKLPMAGACVRAGCSRYLV